MPSFRQRIDGHFFVIPAQGITLMPMKLFKVFGSFVTSLLVVCLLFACGGSKGFPPVVTAVKVQSISYGRTATLYLGGKDLRSSLLVDTGGACTNPSFAASSTTDFWDTLQNLWIIPQLLILARTVAHLPLPSQQILQILFKLIKFLICQEIFNTFSKLLFYWR